MNKTQKRISEIRAMLAGEVGSSTMDFIDELIELERKEVIELLDPENGGEITI